jgi:VCBS repeat-containing protein
MPWAAIGAALLKGLAALWQWLQNRQLLQAGQAEQRSADQAAAQHEEGQAHEVAIDIAGRSDAAIDELSEQWTRPGPKRQ